jgi:hypothetical protein
MAMIRHLKLLAACVLLSLLPADLQAERKYIIGSGISFTTGASTSASVSGLGFEQLSSGFSPFYGSYPSIEIQSTGRNSVLDVSYAFGLYRLQSDLNVGSESHALSANFNTRLGEKWKLTLSQSFEAAPDFTSFNAFRGVIAAPQGFEYIFEPVVLRRSGTSNRVNGNLDYDLNPKTSLSFGLSHALRSYEENPAFRGRLSDQNRIEGNISYSRKIDKHRGWNLKYALFRNDFRDFDDALTHDATIGYSHQLTPTVSLDFGVGPSYTKSGVLSGNYWGYNSSLSLQKSIRSNRLSLYYMRRNGDSTGMGFISNTHTAGLAAVALITRRTTFSLDVSAFDSGQRELGEVLRSWGISGSANLAFALSRHWYLSAGASYRKHVVGIVDSDQRTVFVALRFQAPESWRFAR